MAYVFTFHMFVTLQSQLHILIMFLPCLFISVFGTFVLHCVHCIMQIEWHKTTELLYTHTVHCTHYRGGMGHGTWSIYGNRWDYSFIYRRSFFFFSHWKDSPECIRRIYWSWNSKLTIFRGQKCVIGHFSTIFESSLVLTIFAYIIITLIIPKHCKQLGYANSIFAFSSI